MTAPPSRDAPPSAAPVSAHPGMGFGEFVCLIAAIMASGALAIDAMLPALPTIGVSLGVADANQRQWVVTAYILGLGAAQLVYGPLTDRYGRKPVLALGLGLYALFGAVAAFAGSFETLLLARALQGVGAACGRVLTVAIVRDCYEGNEMAKVMSLAFLVFLAVPVIAPSMGQLILLIAPWRWIFSVLALFALGILLWALLRLPETLPVARRQPIAWATLWQAARITLADRAGTGYTLALTVMIGGLFGFINTAPQLFDEVFHAPQAFPLVFGVVGIFMAAASLLNARFVQRLGMHRVSHGALIAYVAVAVLHAGVALAGWETLASFSVLQAAMLFCFGLVVSNFGAMAMDPLGHVAGVASAVQGFISTVGGALLGFLVGQQFDGTVVPVTLGYAVLGALSLVIVLVTERGTLFRATPGHGDGITLALH